MGAEGEMGVAGEMGVSGSEGDVGGLRIFSKSENTLKFAATSAIAGGHTLLGSCFLTDGLDVAGVGRLLGFSITF